MFESIDKKIITHWKPQHMWLLVIGYYVKPNRSQNSDKDIFGCKIV